jgi:hypothetical protein
MTSLLQKINEVDLKVDGLDSSNLQTQITTNSNDISTLQTNTQDKLIAGDNITIVGNTISSSGGGTTEDIGFLAYHNTTTTYSSPQKLPYNLVRYNSGNGYDNSLYIFTVPVSGKYYFYASYFTVSGSSGTVDLMLKKVGEEQKLQARGQEGQSTPSTHERRTVSVIVECEVGDQLYGVISFNTVRLSPGTYNSSDDTIYGPYGCQLIT